MVSMIPVGESTLEKVLEDELAKLEAGTGGSTVLRATIDDLPDARDREVWTQIVDATLWVGGGDDPGAPPRPERVAAAMEGGSRLRGAVLRACHAGERASAWALDAARLASFVQLRRRVLSPEDPPAAALALRAAELWLALLEGAEEGAAAQSLGREAGRQHCGALVVQAMLLQALFALHAGDLPRGLACARQGFRMACAEGLPVEEALAHVVLARVRRYAGKAHLSIHILAGLAQAAPAAWRGWIAWERTLAGQLATSPDAQSPPGRAATAIQRALQAAAAADRPAFEAAAAAATTELAACPAFAREADAFVSLVDQTRSATAEVEAWRAGSYDRPPFGVTDPGAPVPGGAPSAGGGLVVARAGAPGRRTFEAGVPLVGALRDDEGPSLVVTDQRRTGIALSILALAGPEGMTREEFFQVAYGLRFDPPAHAGALDVLLHRVRAVAAGHGEMTRREGRVSLHLRRTLVVADPRCQPGAEARLVRRLSEQGTMTSEAAAEVLGMPVRTAREVLRTLVEEGACRVLREGRQVHYQVVDTTFGDPTPTPT